jgi:transcriptional regulator with XRE-family HTH domain
MDNIINKKKSIPKPTFLGPNLKFLRRIHGKSQRDIAEAVGLSRNNIASYESGMVEPNAANFLKIAAHFDIEPANFLQDLMTEHPLHTNPSVEPEQHTMMMDKMEAFVKETNEMTKVHEGYKALMLLKKETDEYKQHMDLYSSLEDLLDLLKNVLTLNWDLIQSIIPSEEEGSNPI